MPHDEVKYWTSERYHGGIALKFSCPVCGEAVLGNNERALSAEFRDHLTKAHTMDIPAIRSGGGKLAFGAEPTVEGTKGEGAFGAEIHGRAHRAERVRTGSMGPQTEVSIHCPFCDTRILGADENEETKLVKSHMQGEHGLP